ncbi:MAG: hypothetical protein LH618_02900, partial [Saprospiraceae bacterium]|nr:hypothetical protein [Saprospiraceae bacterium]
NQVEPLHEFFEKQALKVQTDLRKLSPELHGRMSWAAVYYLVTITRLCLRHYGDLLKSHGTLPLDDRSKMVVDMGRWYFRWRAVRQFFRGSN